MPLVDLQTNLKSLKFGNVPKKEIEGGTLYVQQPYVVNDIPIGDIAPSSEDHDWFVRGGMKVLNHLKTDGARITRWFKDGNNGALFTAQQNALSAIAVRTENSDILNGGIYTPLQTIAQTFGAGTGLHLPKQLETRKYFKVVQKRNTEENNKFLNTKSQSTYFSLGQYYANTEWGPEFYQALGEAPDMKRNKHSMHSNDPLLDPSPSPKKVKEYKTSYKNRLLKFWDKTIINTTDANNLLYGYPGGPGVLFTRIMMEDSERTGINNVEIGKGDTKKYKFLFGLSNRGWKGFGSGIVDFQKAKEKILITYSNNPITKTILGISPKYVDFNRN